MSAEREKRDCIPRVKKAMMTRSFVLNLLLGATCIMAQPKENIFKHLSWSARGTHDNQSFGMNGLDTIGYLNDTIWHAIAVGSDGRSKLIYNRFPGDTTTQYWFPGEKVIRGNINGDAFPDFVVWSFAAQTITVLLGTATVNEFIIALTIQGSNTDFQYLDNSIVVADLDGDGFDDILISDPVHQDSSRQYVGRILFYRGGSTLDTLPAQVALGKSRPSDYVGGLLGLGRIKDAHNRCVIEYRDYELVGTNRLDTLRLMLYPTGKGFQLVPTDTLLLVLDTSKYCCFGSVLSIVDIDNDGIDDILLTAGDLHPTDARFAGGYAVFAYRGGDAKSQPDFFFHCPFATGSTTYGQKIVDLGDITGRGYHTIAVTDPDASLGNLHNGAVFLFNVGKALRDSCVAYGVGDYDEGHFGSQVIPLWDETGDGRREFMVSGNSGLFNEGGVYVFNGDTSYGPLTYVQQTSAQATGFRLGQSFPNPSYENTQFTFSVPNGEVVLALFDVMGREVQRLYDGRGDGMERSVHIDTRHMSPGTYVYRLAAGGRQETNTFSVMR